MKTHQPTRLIALASILAVPIMAAQAAEEQGGLAPEFFNRVTLNYRAGFNIHASFKSLGQSPLSSPADAGGGTDHIYDNGYVRVDSTGNEGGVTTFWGYEDNDQVVDDNLVMSSSLPGDFGRDVSDDPQHGFEFSYLSRLGTLGKMPWGFEVAVNFTSVNLHDDGTRTDGPLIVDAYPLDGMIPPAAPYQGLSSAEYPQPLLGDTPTRVPVSTKLRLDAPVYGLRLGPFLQVPLFKRAAVLFSGGFALAIVDAEFDYEHNVTIPGGESLTVGDKDSKGKAMPGGYVAAHLLYRVTETISLSAGVQYQNVGTFKQSAGDKEVKLDLSESIFATVGLVFGF